MWKDDTERYGAYVIAKVLGASVIETDIPGAPPGTVDGEIQYSDGRTAAVEFTSVQPQERHHLSEKLKPMQLSPAPGQLTWGIHPENVADLRRLLKVYRHIILETERYGRARPEELPFDVISGDPELRWIAWDSRSTMGGVVSEHDPVVFWLNPSIATFIGDPPAEIFTGVEEALNIEPCVSHLSKLLRDTHAERHLFLGVGMGGLSDAASLVLMNGPKLPDRDPAMPKGVDHLWLGPGFGKSVTVWSKGPGWRNEWLSDPEPDTEAK